MHCPGAEARGIIEAKIYKEISGRFDQKELDRIVRYSFENGGKRCRAILLLLSTGALAGQEEKAVEAAAAVELIHTSSLIFDDMLDNETCRRRSEPLHVAFGRSAAITCGLFLASMAVEMLSRYRNEEIMKATADALVGSSRGEMLDVLSQPRDNLDHYIQVASLKTGALFGASARIGALLAEPTRDYVGTLFEFGQLVGIAFQLRDDFLDLGRDLRSKSVPKSITPDMLSRLSSEYAEKAKVSIGDLRSESTRLVEFADYVCKREE